MESESRRRGQRGPDRKPRKKRTPPVVKPNVSVVDQIAQMKADPVDQARYVPRKRKRVAVRIYGAMVPVNLADALDEMIDTWQGYGTEKSYVVRHAFIWLVTTYAPEIAKAHGIEAAPTDQFVFPAPRPTAPKNPYGSARTWDDPGQTEASVEAMRNRGNGIGLSNYGDTLPPADAILPGSSYVTTAGNGEVKDL